MANNSQAKRTGCEEGIETGERTIIDEILACGSVVSRFLTGATPVRRFCSSVT
jgi:hypothetical protein